GHTEAVVTDSLVAAQRFVAGVDAAAVMVNASTRFTDGGEFGFGAEIGISNQKLHARGPMGLPELTSTTYVVTGDGHVRDCAGHRWRAPRRAGRGGPWRGGAMDGGGPSRAGPPKGGGRAGGWARGGAGGGLGPAGAGLLLGPLFRGPPPQSRPLTPPGSEPLR